MVLLIQQKKNRNCSSLRMLLVQHQRNNLMIIGQIIKPPCWKCLLCLVSELFFRWCYWRRKHQLSPMPWDSKIYIWGYWNIISRMWSSFRHSIAAFFSPKLGTFPFQTPDIQSIFIRTKYMQVRTTIFFTHFSFISFHFPSLDMLRQQNILAIQVIAIKICSVYFYSHLQCFYFYHF